MDKNPEISAYVESLEGDRREAIEALRNLVHMTAPQAVETSKYRMPTYALKDSEDTLMSFKGQKHHISVYMDVDLVEKYRNQMPGLNIGKSCIRFKTLGELPLDVIRQILVETVEKQGG